jgi:phosphoribosyl 1,2-cyclic phosphate phosphodiesterase
MDLRILGSGGCSVIPKPLCRCHVCNEAREKGIPYERSGPSAFIHDENILIDTPAEIITQLNRTSIASINYLLLTHLDPDHIEGFRVVEQITLDFRSWRAYPDENILLLIPLYLHDQLKRMRSTYGSLIDYYENQGFIKCETFKNSIRIGKVTITAIPVYSGKQVSSVYVFDSNHVKMVYAPCDIKPFPEEREEIQSPDLLVIQPGIFETGLKHDFRYDDDHISRSTLFTFEETLELANRIKAARILFVHLEEYWNRTYDDYLVIQKMYKNIEFAYDNMLVKI